MYMKLITNNQIMEGRLSCWFLRIHELSLRYFKLEFHIRVKLPSAVKILSAYGRGNRQEPSVVSTQLELAMDISEGSQLESHNI
jgi:hypothetical protein